MSNNNNNNTRQKRKNRKRKNFLKTQTSTVIPWTVDGASCLPNGSLSSYLNFCTNQSKPKDHFNNSFSKSNIQNAFYRFSEKFESNNNFTGKFNIYNVNMVKKPANEQDLTNWSVVSREMRKLARNRLFHHVGSFIGENGDAVKFMYNKLCGDAVVLKTLHTCKSALIAKKD